MTRSFSWEGRCYDSQEPMMNFYLSSDPNDDLVRVVKGIKRLSWTSQFRSEHSLRDDEFSYITLIAPQVNKDDVIQLLKAMGFTER